MNSRQASALIDFWKRRGAARYRYRRPDRREIARDHVGQIVSSTPTENPAVTGKLGITTSHRHLYKDGEIVKTIVGAMPKPKLLRELEPFLG